jgi:hypothetical protein
MEGFPCHPYSSRCAVFHMTAYDSIYFEFYVNIGYSIE